MRPEPIVSVIIPVFNAEDTLHIALESLLKQTYPHLEMVMINDCSTDNTLQVIHEFVPVLEARDIHVNVACHEQNQGVAAARNSGLDKANGEFIYFLDADDHLEPNAIDLLVAEALVKNADIVGCNWFLSFERNERKMNQPEFKDPKEAIEKMLVGTMRWNLWLFLVRRSLYVDHQIRFVPGMNMGEDLLVMVKLFLQASRVAYVDQALYHYGQSNDQSLSKIYSDRHIREVSANIERIERCLLDSRFRDETGNHIDFLKLNIKLPLLISDKEEWYQTWLNWFPEANKRVMSNRALPLRTRLIQWLAVKKQFWAIKLYYRVVIRFVYGRLYR